MFGFGWLTRWFWGSSEDDKNLVKIPESEVLSTFSAFIGDNDNADRKQSLIEKINIITRVAGQNSGIDPSSEEFLHFSRGLHAIQHGLETSHGDEVVLDRELCEKMLLSQHIWSQTAEGLRGARADQTPAFIEGLKDKSIPPVMAASLLEDSGRRLFKLFEKYDIKPYVEPLEPPPPSYNPTPFDDGFNYQ